MARDCRRQPMAAFAATCARNSAALRRVSPTTNSRPADPTVLSLGAAGWQGAPEVREDEGALSDGHLLRRARLYALARRECHKRHLTERDRQIPGEGCGEHDRLQK